MLMIEGWKESVDEALRPYRDLLPPDAMNSIQDSVPDFILSAKEAFAGRLVGWFSHIGFLVELILVPVLVFYFLADGPSLRNEVKVFCPAPWRSRIARIFDHLDRVLDGYIRGQVLMCLIAWVLVTLGLLALGVPHAFTLGLLAGLTRALALELAVHNINVNYISPGPANTVRTTPLQFDMKKIPMGRTVEPSEIAAPVLMLCGAKGRYITGQTLHVNGGLYMNS